MEPVAPRDGSSSRGETEPDSLTVAQSVAIATLQTILRERGDSAAMIAAAVEEATARLQGERLVVGTIVKHGKARYGHDEQAEQSYVVTVATAKGEKDVWGVDLARAMEHSGAKIGDAVALIQRAHERVTVQSPVKNESRGGRGHGTPTSHAQSVGRAEFTDHRSQRTRQSHRRCAGGDP